MCIWKEAAPRITNTTVINDGNLKAYTLVTEVLFDVTCPLEKEDPPIQLTITDSNHQKIFFDILTLEKFPEIQSPVVPKLTSNPISMVPDGTFIGLNGNIKVDYNNGCVYFKKGSYYYKDENNKYPLDGVVIVSWKPQVSPEYNASLLQAPPQIPPWFPVIHNTLTITTFINDNILDKNKIDIETQINFKGGQIPEISLVVTNPTTAQPATYNLTLFTPAKFSFGAGDTYPGLNSVIKVDYEQGCIFFDNYNDYPYLIKPEKDIEGIGNYWLRFMKIFDWAGRPLPGQAYVNPPLP